MKALAAMKIAETGIRKIFAPRHAATDSMPTALIIRALSANQVLTAIRPSAPRLPDRHHMPVAIRPVNSMTSSSEDIPVYKNLE